MIDVNAFLGKWPFEDLPDSDPLGFKKIMKKEGIVKAMVSPIEGIFYKDPQIANENLFKAIKRFPGLIPVAVINPALANWEEAVSRNINDHKVKGIKIYPNYHFYDLNNKNLKLMLKKLERLNMPVIFQVRMEDKRTHNPLMKVPDLDLKNILRVVRYFPDLQVVLAGVLYGEVNENRTVILKRPNVFIEISFIERLNCIKKLIDLIGCEKIMFGTHHPFFYIRSTVGKIQESELSREEYTAVLTNNAEKIFKT